MGKIYLLLSPTPKYLHDVEFNQTEGHFSFAIDVDKINKYRRRPEKFL
jgi:hypothetical protein